MKSKEQVSYKFGSKIKEIFPDLTEEQILNVIKENRLLIRSKIPIIGETTMKFGYGVWTCDTCGHIGDYSTYCHGCNRNNITLCG